MFCLGAQEVQPQHTWVLLPHPPPEPPSLGATQSASSPGEALHGLWERSFPGGGRWTWPRGACAPRWAFAGTHAHTLTPTEVSTSREEPGGHSLAACILFRQPWEKRPPEGPPCSTGLLASRHPKPPFTDYKMLFLPPSFQRCLFLEESFGSTSTGSFNSVVEACVCPCDQCWVPEPPPAPASHLCPHRPLHLTCPGQLPKPTALSWARRDNVVFSGRFLLLQLSCRLSQGSVSLGAPGGAPGGLLSLIVVGFESTG